MAGIYIHIPYCKKACHYCNFHFSTTRYNDDLMIEAITKEAYLRRDFFVDSAVKDNDHQIQTIYFGGGTPSILPVQAIEQILNSIFKHFSVSDKPEITLEANPDDMDIPTLKAWKTAGINRLSVGVQSFHQQDLTWMNRAHNSDQSLQAIIDSQDQGLENLSIDLIYGTPFLNETLWMENLEQVAKLEVPHLSAYALTVEPRTALFKMIEKGKIPPVDPEKQALHFEMLMDWAAGSGYEHYEISNLAKAGHRSQHNSNYWGDVPYLGLGPAAHSYNGHSRSWNLANNQIYIQKIQADQPPIEEEQLTAENMINEYIMTRLRLIEGINVAQFEARFGKTRLQTVLDQAPAWLASGHILLQENRLLLTRKGKHFADAIAADLFV